MEHNFNNIIITGTAKEQFKKKIKENIEKADRIAALINENKELYFQSEEKLDRSSELIIANKELALPSYK